MVLRLGANFWFFIHRPSILILNYFYILIHVNDILLFYIFNKKFTFLFHITYFN
jgi:hypothetical protein